MRVFMRMCVRVLMRMWLRLDVCSCAFVDGCSCLSMSVFLIFVDMFFACLYMCTFVCAPT